MEVKAMKGILLNSITCAGLLLVSLAAQAAAQYQDDDSWHHGREEFFASTEWKLHMFDRMREDLDHVQDVAFHKKDEHRIVDTKKEITELQDKMAAGKYDEPKLNDVINRLEKVVADNRLAPSDRDMLNDDLSRARDYRAHHDNWR
jgi:hypothetical protein